MKGLNYRRMVLHLLLMVFAGMSVHADGFIVIPVDPRPLPRPVPEFNPFPLEVKYHHVDVRIEDNIATTAIDQVFYNPSRFRMEGYYMFPVPADGVIRTFSMFINGREVPAELLDSKKARRIYEDIVRKMKDPALLEYSNQRVFRARIYPIEPLSEKRVKISYSEVLTKDSATTEYVYPLNTEKFSSRPLDTVRIRAEIRSAGSIGSVYSPTHEIEILRKNKNQASAVYEESSVTPNRDFKLYFNTLSGDVGISLRSYRIRGEDGFFMLNLSPGFSGNLKRIPMDISFVLDVSGSMAGEKLEKAKNALRFCVNNLGKDDRFNIIRFSTEAEALFDSPENADRRNRKSGLEFINGLRAIGGTNIEEALSMALKRGPDRKRPYIIVFITDGKPTIGETGEDRLVSIIQRKNTRGTRIFTFGIGNDLNTHLLDKITSITRAYRSYIGEKEDIEVKISAFFRKIESPVLTDLEIETGKSIRISKIHPKDLPDLFAGSSVSVFGRYTGGGKAEVKLSGLLNGEKRSFYSECEFTGGSVKDDFIPVLWASRRIGYLLDQIRLNGEQGELVGEITQLAKKYGIITPYTSYLIVEDEKNLVARREIVPSQQVMAPSVTDGRAFSRVGMEESDSLKTKSGAPGVRASREAQNLKTAENFSGTRQGGERMDAMNVRDGGDFVRQRVKNVQGRAFYNNGSYWIDPEIHLKKHASVKKVKFGSDDYFKLLKDHPETAQFLSLGRNVQFIFNDLLIEVNE